MTADVTAALKVDHLVAHWVGHLVACLADCSAGHWVAWTAELSVDLTVAGLAASMVVRMAV